jgi:hypothetical protein
MRVIVCCLACYLSVVLLLYLCQRVKTNLQLNNNNNNNNDNNNKKKKIKNNISPLFSGMNSKPSKIQAEAGENLSSEDFLLGLLPALKIKAT